MYNSERIVRMMKDIEGYKKDLEIIKIKRIGDLKNVEKKHASSMLCFAILNRVINLGEEILVKEDQQMPSRYGEIFTSLAKAGVLNNEEAKKINELIDLRNVIAHAYFDLTNKQIFKIIENINLIDKFIEKIKKRVKENG